MSCAFSLGWSDVTGTEGPVNTGTSLVNAPDAKLGIKKWKIEAKQKNRVWVIWLFCFFIFAGQVTEFHCTVWIGIPINSILWPQGARMEC